MMNVLRVLMRCVSWHRVRLRTSSGLRAPAAVTIRCPATDRGADIDTPTRQVATYGPKYPARRLLELVGDKWTPVVLFTLAGSDKRFGEIQDDIPDVSKKVLVQVLRHLESGGLVVKSVMSEVPRRTRYRLTPDGHTLHDAVASFCDWASDHEAFLDEIHRRRDASRGMATGPAPSTEREDA